jgi:predicted DNA-binding transcriptional regulator YafY
VVDAIRRSEAIEVQSQSLSSPKPRWRWMAPHAIAFDGFRWHARAFCFGDAVFKDFLLSRILDIRGSRASDVPAENDQDWHSFATLEITPQPALSGTQAKVIALDTACAAARQRSGFAGHCSTMRSGAWGSTPTRPRGDHRISRSCF